MFVYFEHDYDNEYILKVLSLRPAKKKNDNPFIQNKVLEYNKKCRHYVVQGVLKLRQYADCNEYL